MKMRDGIVSVFHQKKAIGMMTNVFFTIDEKDETHQTMMEIEPLLIASGCRTWENILLTHGEYPYHCLEQTLWYPKRANLGLVWDAGELFSMGLPDQAQIVSILVVSAVLTVVNAGTSEQEMAVPPTPEQLSKVSVSKKLDLFKTTGKVLRIPEAIEKDWARFA